MHCSSCSPALSTHTCRPAPKRQLLSCLCVSDGQTSDMININWVNRNGNFCNFFGKQMISPIKAWLSTTDIAVKILCEQILQNRYSTWDRILHTHMPSNTVPKCSVPLAVSASVQSRTNRCAAWPAFAKIPRKFCNDIVWFECPRHMLHYTLTNVNLS